MLGYDKPTVLPPGAQELTLYQLTDHYIRFLPISKAPKKGALKHELKLVAVVEVALLQRRTNPDTSRYVSTWRGLSSNVSSNPQYKSMAFRDTPAEAQEQIKGTFWVPMWLPMCEFEDYDDLHGTRVADEPESIVQFKIETEERSLRKGQLLGEGRNKEAYQSLLDGRRIVLKKFKSAFMQGSLGGTPQIRGFLKEFEWRKHPHQIRKVSKESSESPV
jgi:hypothetical protein